MLDTQSCKYCKTKAPVVWEMFTTKRVCNACAIFGPQRPGPGHNLRLKRKEKEHE